MTFISVRYQNYESVLFQGCEEEKMLENFANYIADKDPDVIFCRSDSDVSSVLQNMYTRAKKVGLTTSSAELSLIELVERSSTINK
jgi:DNA polymerase elongation subunit (family B)